jgi:hypothetical protein
MTEKMSRLIKTCLSRRVFLERIANQFNVTEVSDEIAEKIRSGNVPNAEIFRLLTTNKGDIEPHNSRECIGFRSHIYTGKLKFS